MRSVSAIVTTFERSDTLRLALAALECQSVRPSEVIIADDGSGPEHESAAREIAAASSLPVTYIRQERRGARRAALRNLAARHATGDYLFFTDGDAVLFPDVLEIHLAAAGRRCWVSGYGIRLTPAETSDVTEEIVRGGRLEEVWPAPDDPRLDLFHRDAVRTRRRQWKLRLWRTEARMRKVRLITMQASLPREAFERVNGFDEAYEGWGEEDVDLGFRLQLAGLRPRSVLEESRALHLDHDPPVRRRANLDRLRRPRRGRYVCDLGLVRLPGAPEPAPAGPEPAADPPADAWRPRFLLLHVNQRCNLRCLHCRYWHRGDEDRDRYLAPDRKREVIEEFAELGPGGRVVICGGESMLDLEDYFAISVACRRVGLRCLSVTRGTRVTDDALADRMIREGPHEITISLDSHEEEEHDRMRGVSGAFAKAVRAIRRLTAARDRAPESDTRVLAMALVHEGNYRELPAFYEFALGELGVDKLKLNFVQPSFGGTGADVGEGLAVAESIRPRSGR